MELLFHNWECTENIDIVIYNRITLLHTIRGFRFTISAEDATLVTARTGLVSYFIDLISLFVGACCLAFVGYKNTKGLGVKKRIVVLIILYFTLVMFIVGGFRYRLVILILALATTYHLYPSPRKINYIVLVPVAIITYLGFAIMDKARSYGRGIDLDVAKTISLRMLRKVQAKVRMFAASVLQLLIIILETMSLQESNPY